jgi:hypothetical protein
LPFGVDVSRPIPMIFSDFARPTCCGSGCGAGEGA